MAIMNVDEIRLNDEMSSKKNFENQSFSNSAFNNIIIPKFLVK